MTDEIETNIIKTKSKRARKYRVTLDDLGERLRPHIGKTLTLERLESIRDDLEGELARLFPDQTRRPRLVIDTEDGVLTLRFKYPKPVEMWL